MQVVKLDKTMVKAFIAFREQSNKEHSMIKKLTESEAGSLINTFDLADDGTAFVLQDKGSIIGQLFVENANDNSNSLRMLLISVLAEYYRTSAAKTLLDKAFSEAKKNNQSTVELIVRKDNLRAIAFYEKNSFKNEGDFTKKTLFFVKKV